MIKRKKFFFTHLIFISLQFLCVFNEVNAQAMPDFSIRLTNGKMVSSKQLPPQKPVIIIVFSPDCGHCKTLIDGIFKNINRFKNVQIIMATFVQERDIIAFEKKYHIANYPNIMVGSDVPVLFFQKFYNLTSTPFTALYDKNKKMVVSYRNENIVEDLMKRLKVLP